MDSVGITAIGAVACVAAVENLLDAHVSGVLPLALSQNADTI